MRPHGHVSKNTSAGASARLSTKPSTKCKTGNFDGMVITGAPVEQMPFEEVDYWPELCQIMEWSKTNVHSTFHICWGAQAGLYYHYGIQKRAAPGKALRRVPPPGGLQACHPASGALTTNSGFPTPGTPPCERADIEAVPDLKILASSPEAGVYAVMTKEGRQIFVTGHAEYDRGHAAKRNTCGTWPPGLPIRVPSELLSQRR